MASVAENKLEDWMTRKWRPMMAVTYMATIWFDFIVGPIVFNILQYGNADQAVTGWVPLTLQGGGLYHVAMGAILGIAAWTRGKEKIAVIENTNNTTTDTVIDQSQLVRPQQQGMRTDETWQTYPNQPASTWNEPASNLGKMQPQSYVEPEPDPVPSEKVSWNFPADVGTDPDRPLRRKKI